MQADLAAVARIGAVPTILRVITEATGLRLALVARVTRDSWTACAVLDRMNFGLKTGDHLDVATTLCSEVRDSQSPILVEHASVEPEFCGHPTPKLYGFESYIAVPIVRPNGEYFGNVCALDAEPARLRDEKTLAMMQLFAELIARQLTLEEDAVRDRHALAREREAAELREQFIAVLGHDLRNPLSAITAGAGFLSDVVEDPTQRAVLERVRSSAGRMSHLIDDIMDFARGRLGGGVTLVRESVDVNALAEDVVAEIREAHPTRAIDVTADLAGTVWVDRGRVAQLLSNLVANAVEHGAPDAPIHVGVARTDEALRLTVRSRGEPIAPDVMARLFQPYYRAGDRGARSGLGLGLFIADAIARAHGGAITATSTADGVTTFAVDLPFDAASRVVDAAPAPASQESVAGPGADAGYDLLYDPARLHLLADTGLVDASAAARLPVLDRIAHLAARATGSAVAQVNLVTDAAQVPVAAFVDCTRPGPDGASLDAGGAELEGAWRTPVGIARSYCQHVVRVGAPLLIEDAESHPLVRDNEATREGGIRSYAAVPLVTPTGVALGSVCVVDFVPRRWTPADVSALAECATLAGEEVAARLGAARALRDSEAQLRRALGEARAAREAAESARDQAEAARRDAEAASRAKSEFLAAMSHELRTPLNAIAGHAGLLELDVHGPLSADQRAAVDRIQRGQRHLLELIDGVLNYSQLEAGALQYAREPVALDDVLATCEALVGPEARARGLTLSYVPGDATPSTLADREKVRQIVLGLLANATRFTESGGRVTLTCDADGDVVRVRVADTGCGIPPDQLERVFQPFVQVDARLTRTRDGMGMGLALGRALARGMGGDLTVESALGAGSTFTLVLPRA